MLQQNDVFWLCSLCQDSSIAVCKTHNFDHYAHALLTSTYAAGYRPQRLYFCLLDWQTLRLHQVSTIFMTSCLSLCCLAWANQAAQTVFSTYMMTVANTHEILCASYTQYCSPVCTELDFLHSGVVFIALVCQRAH